MPPGVSSRSSTSQAPSPITPLCTSEADEPGETRDPTAALGSRLGAGKCHAAEPHKPRGQRLQHAQARDGLAPALQRLGEACGLLLALAGLAQGPLRGEIVER